MGRARIAPLLVVVAGAIYFGLTCSRDLAPFDSTELTLNALQLGVGHPPGQPLYLLVSAATVRLLRFLSPSHALAWLSIVAVVVAAGWALVFAGRQREGGVGAIVQPSGSNQAKPPRTVDGLAVLAGLGTFLLPGVWDLSSRAEVYPLGALFLAGALFVALQHDDAALHNRRALGVGLLLGLGAAVNPAMAVAVGVGLAPYLLSRPSLTRTLLLVSGAVLGLTPYLLLPLLGAHPGTKFVWGEPLAGDALGFYLSGRDYRAWHVGVAELVHNLGAALSWLLAEGILPWLVLGSIGFALSTLPRAGKVVLPLGAAVSTLLLALNHPFIPSNPDYDGYLLPWVWLALAGVVLLCRRLDERPRGVALSFAVVLLCAIVGVLSGAPLPERGASPAARRRAGPTRTLAQQALDETPTNGILLVESDHLVFGTLYLHHVEGVRPDVAVINVGWANSSWYWRHLGRVDPRLPAPDLAAPSREQRLARLLRQAGRPVTAERMRLASLADSRVCMYGLFARAGAACNERPASPRAEALRTVRRSLAGALTPLDRRVVAQAAVMAAEDTLRASREARLPFELLRSAAPPSLLAGLRGEPPPPSAPPRLTPLDEPRALLPSEALLVRMGDLLASTDPRAALACYRRADLPEAHRAIAAILDENHVVPEGSAPAPDVAPRGD